MYWEGIRAHWKRQGIQWKMACSEHQRTWFEKSSSRKCFSLASWSWDCFAKRLIRVCRVWSKFQSSVIGDIVIGGYNSVLKKERLAIVFLSSHVWSWLPHQNGERTRRCSGGSPSNPRPSEEPEAELWLGDSVFYELHWEETEEKLLGRVVLSKGSNCFILGEISSGFWQRFMENSSH